MSDSQNFWTGFFVGAGIWLFFISGNGAASIPAGNGLIDQFLGAITVDEGTAIKVFITYSLIGGIAGYLIGVFLKKR